MSCHDNRTQVYEYYSQTWDVSTWRATITVSTDSTLVHKRSLDVQVYYHFSDFDRQICSTSLTDDTHIDKMFCELSLTVYQQNHRTRQNVYIVCTDVCSGQFNHSSTTTTRTSSSTWSTSTQASRCHQEPSQKCSSEWTVQKAKQVVAGWMMEYERYDSTLHHSSPLLTALDISK